MTTRRFHPAPAAEDAEGSTDTLGNVIRWGGLKTSTGNGAGVDSFAGFTPLEID
jgi:hypothetical protein